MDTSPSSLGKDVEEIAGLIVFLTRDLLRIQAVNINFNNVSVNLEEDEGGGVDEECDNNRDNYINYNDDD